MPPIALTGFMGSGKTTYGKAAAKAAGWVFVDLDDEIEKVAGDSISNIFSTQGEKAFRELELATLERTANAACKAASPVLLALGGGTILQETAREALKRHGIKVIYLKASAQTIRKNLIGQEDKRPLLRNGGLEELLASREPIYAAAADITIDTDPLSGLEVIAEIRKVLDA